MVHKTNGRHMLNVQLSERLAAQLEEAAAADPEKSQSQIMREGLRRELQRLEGDQ